MKFLQELYSSQLNEKPEDLSALPEDVMKEIQKNIRDGADDKEQDWANALELVHKAYDVAGVDRPMPNMEAAWEQYEENIQYAVKQLSKSRGVKADWRMSASNLGEQRESPKEFVVLDEEEQNVISILEGQSMDHVIKQIVANQQQTDAPVRTKPKVLNETHGILEFWYHGGVKGSTYHIRQSK